jgi:hypothetical protein
MSLCRIGRVTKFTKVIFARSENDSRFGPKELIMQNSIPQQNWSHHFDEVERDTQLKRILNDLQDENNQLKKLVVRLSETIIRNVTAKR